VNPTDRPRPLRIALTGGPGAGKTTAADLFRREIGDDVIVVPEAATILFGGGFPRVSEEAAERSLQRAIFEVQHSLEDVQATRYPDRVLLCDRGSVDGAAYWPDGASEFFSMMNSSYEAELARYDVVLFFETSAVGGIRLRDLWSPHPRFHLVPHSSSFIRKITVGLSILESVVAELHPGRRNSTPEA
jgi:predicted ATPase